VKLSQVFTGDTQTKLWGNLSILAVLVTVITPLVVLITFLVSHSANIPATILAVYACFLISALLFMLIRQEARYRREIRYAPAMVPLRKAFASLADASWTLLEGDGSEESFLLHLRESLRFLAEAFSLITNETCRASIKMTSASAIGDEPEPGRALDVEVVTLCRNTDEDEAQHIERDRIGNNTDFRQIFTENAVYFFCNNLPAQLNRGYQNSHWDARIIQANTFDYRATIVWPIARSRLIDRRAREQREIIGFLCVDTPATDVFNETYDVPLGAAFSQALHLTLLRFRDKGRTPQSGTAKSGSS
jgi:hypothetical protein